MTDKEVMAYLAAANTLRPGVAWNIRGDMLEQAEDGTPRVSIPTDDEIRAILTKGA